MVARAVLDFFASEAGRQVLARLRALGIDPKGRPAAAQAHPFSGKTLVLTGSLAQITRGEATERIRARGRECFQLGEPRTDFVVVGENAGSKLEDAKAAGVATLDEAAFLQMLGA